MKNFKFSTKVYVAIGVLFALMLTMGIQGYLKIGEFHGAIGELKENHYARTVDIMDANVSLLQWNRALLNHIASDTKEEQAKHQSNGARYREEFSTLVKKLQGQKNSKEGQALLDGIAGYFEEAMTARTEVLGLSEQGKDKEAFTTLRAKFRPVVDKIDAGITSFITLKKTQFEAADKETNEMYKAATTLFISLIAAGLGLSLLVFFMIAGTIRIFVRVMGDLNQSSNQVAAASEQIGSSSQELSSTANEQASAIEETSASLEQMSGMIDNNLRDAEASARQADSVRESAEQGNETMSQLVTAMKEINEANNKVEQLVKVIGEIGEKTAVIDEIVFQTKLLSFNASVEAERAGEHGRGFAVVAQEVGNLAQMSGKAATEISGIVKESIKSAEAVVTDNKRKVEVGSGLVNQSAQVLQQMKKAAEQMAASARQIMNASKEQSTGVKQVSLAMDNLNKATQDTAATAEEAAGAGEELSAQATHLDGYVGELAKIIHGDSVKEVSAQKPARAEHPSAPVHAEGGSAKVHKLQPRKKSQAAAQPMKKAAGAELLSVPSMNGGDQDEWEKL